MYVRRFWIARGLCDGLQSGVMYRVNTGMNGARMIFSKNGFGKRRATGRRRTPVVKRAQTGGMLVNPSGLSTCPVEGLFVHGQSAKVVWPGKAEGQRCLVLFLRQTEGEFFGVTPLTAETP
jgi:hypothetical protein